jgi:hypothetical protein
MPYSTNPNRWESQENEKNRTSSSHHAVQKPEHPIPPSIPTLAIKLLEDPSKIKPEIPKRITRRPFGNRPWRHLRRRRLRNGPRSDPRRLPRRLLRRNLGRLLRRTSRGASNLLRRRHRCSHSRRHGWHHRIHIVL